MISMTLGKEPFLPVHKVPKLVSFLQSLRMAWEVELALRAVFVKASC